MLLAAGLRGVEKGYVLGPQAEDNVDPDPRGTSRDGYASCRAAWARRWRRWRAPSWSRKRWGHVFDFFLRNKRTEWENYRSHVVRAEGLPVAVTGGHHRGRVRYRRGRGQTSDAAPEAAQRGPAGAGRTDGRRGSGPARLEHRRARRTAVVAVPRPDADTALRAMVRLADAAGNGWDELNRALVKDRGLRGRLFGTLGSSLALGDHLIAHPQSWHLLAGRVTLPSAKELRRRLHRDRRNGRNINGQGLRCNRCGALPRPADGAGRARPGVDGRERAGAAVHHRWCSPVRPGRRRAGRRADRGEPIGQRQRRRATPACRYRHGQVRCAELNYVSDVDVIFVADAATDSNLALATRVAGAMMRFASETFFEVDAALRPEGQARATGAHAGLLSPITTGGPKPGSSRRCSRHAAGDTQLGEQYIDALMPMVWTACEREDFVPEVQAMRRRVEQLVPAGVRAREIKLGTGGLRDVEFAVQLLQLVHGRNDESLHVASTVDALAALGAGGYVGRDDAANMTASYEFLRLLEHRLQLQRLKHPHAARDRRRRGDAMAGPRGARAARRPARRAGCAARRAQAAKPAGVEAARQALSAAAGVGWSTGAGLSAV